MRNPKSFSFVVVFPVVVHSPAWGKTGIKIEIETVLKVDLLEA